MNEIQVVEKINIEDKIYEVRGKQVMVDFDLAKLYNCKGGTRDINKAVKRNNQKFPEDFMFELTIEEYKILMYQIGTSKIDYRKINKALPKVFTEEGVAMLATIFHTDVANEMSIKIIRAFVSMRKYISYGLKNSNIINSKLLEYDIRISLLEKSFDKLTEKEKINTIFFEGEIYDAYSKIIDILKAAKKLVIIIDAYADKTILDIIKNLDVKVTLICKTKTLLNKLDIDNYNKQYDNLRIIFNDDFHDRYFIIDDNILYHLGTSINHAGSKTFSINKIEDEEVIKLLNNKVKTIMKGENR